MRVLLDTNIVLDYLGANKGFTEDAEKVFDLAAKRKDIKLVSSSAITDILYVLRRAVKDRQLVREKIRELQKENQHSFGHREGYRHSVCQGLKGF